MKIIRYLFLLVFVILSLFLFHNVVFAFSFNIEPARIEVEVKAGGSKNAVVTIDNTKGKNPLHVKAYAQDIAYLPDGSNEFLPEGSTPWSCVGWVTISPKEIDIPAGGYASVKINVKVPKSAKGGYYGVVFFETGPSLEPGSTIGVNVRAGTLFLVSVSKTQVFKAKIMDLKVDKDEESNSYNVEIVISNQSNVLIRPTGRIKILDAKGKKVKTQEINEGLAGILPMTSRKFSIKLEKLELGEYNLQATVDYGGKDLLVGEIPLRVK